MNSTDDSRPVITFTGEGWSANSRSLLEAVGAEACEWRRPLGRPARQVRVEALLCSPAEAPSERPCIHTFWSSCNDVDSWRSTEKDKVEKWIRSIAAGDEWLVILPAPKIADKARTELKQPERCLSSRDPGLLRRVRQMLLTAIGQEEQSLGQDVRRERERRNEQGWSFGEYLALQEKLAALLGALKGVEDEALVQYDELDALFTQFVRNASLVEPPPWLSSFSAPLKEWRGLGLDSNTRFAIVNGDSSLLQLRSYLFTRQLNLLLRMNQPQQIAERCLPLLQICFNELRILEVDFPKGAASCWAVQVALQVLHVCRKFPDQVHSLPAASLCDYACQKLFQLGELLGLMPGGEGPTSTQLDAAVWLGAGLGPEPPFGGEQLKEALGSPATFQKLYLELAELALGTFKHLGRSRSARLLGHQLSNFHQLRGEPHTAAAYLADAHSAVEGWPLLGTNILSQLAECLNGEKLAVARARLAASATLSLEERTKNWHQLLEILDDLDADECVVPLEEIFELVSVQPISGHKQQAKVKLNSLLPEPVMLIPSFSIQTAPPQVIRKESNPRGRRQRGNFSACLSSEPIEIQPGPNEFTLHAQGAVHTGHLCQLSLLMKEKMDFVSAESRLGLIEVKKGEAKVAVESGQLLARMPQKIQLRFTAGTDGIDEGTEITIKAPRGLSLGEGGRQIVIELPKTEQGMESVVPLDVLATPPSAKSTDVEYQLTLSSSLWEQAYQVPVHFTVPVAASVKLHTAMKTKFLQVVVSSTCGQRLMLSEPTLELSLGQSSALPISPEPMVLDPERPLSYIWKLEVDGPVRAKFNVALTKDDTSGFYNCEFELAECATMIVVQSKVAAATGAEVCRANAMCHLYLTVETSEPSGQSLMYELLADHSMWAVCGRTAGVLSMDQSSHSLVLDVMPLTSGFLPHPQVRFSKYIPANAGLTHPKLEPFGPGQVYNKSKSLQVHVLPAVQAS
ncbi:trafficking protein particle complex subunit 10 [Neocloeon triangulifer]|uniref:trafficking protein particle complex subunit 10 n=1 Tax=Neocloeon triangulifer TaxID=2078957 RepID=UPI00286EC421|nr:trafficking protein particle complex subunit 10 [Neocloeon triangulifer]